MNEVKKLVTFFSENLQNILRKYSRKNHEKNLRKNSQKKNLRKIYEKILQNERGFWRQITNGGVFSRFFLPSIVCSTGFPKLTGFV